MFFDCTTTFKALLKDSVVYRVRILLYIEKSAFFMESLMMYEYPEVSFNPKFKVQILKTVTFSCQTSSSLCCSLFNSAVYEVATGSLNHVSE